MGLIHGADRTVGSLFIIVVVVAGVWDLMGVVSVADAALPGRATPRNMEQIVIGRCEEYQRVIHPELFQQNELKNCTDLWQKLRKAFVNKGPCNVTVDSYRDFVDAAYHKIDTQDKVMYWSGGSIFQLVVNFVQVKNKQYLTMREILAAYVIRNIDDWCGQMAPPGINHNECPTWGSCTHTAVSSFWTALSAKFAKQVKGTAHLMLDGSTGQAYRRSREKCVGGSIVDLRLDVEQKGMTFKCSDSDLDILYFQCITNMQANQCKLPTIGG